jgi:hypothetical protein
VKLLSTDAELLKRNGPGLAGVAVGLSKDGHRQRANSALLGNELLPGIRRLRRGVLARRKITGSQTSPFSNRR